VCCSPATTGPAPRADSRLIAAGTRSGWRPGNGAAGRGRAGRSVASEGGGSLGFRHRADAKQIERLELSGEFDHVKFERVVVGAKDGQKYTISSRRAGAGRRGSNGSLTRFAGASTPRAVISEAALKAAEPRCVEDAPNFGDISARERRDLTL